MSPKGNAAVRKERHITVHQDPVNLKSDLTVKESSYISGRGLGGSTHAKLNEGRSAFTQVSNGISSKTPRMHSKGQAITGKI